MLTRIDHGMLVIEIFTYIRLSAFGIVGVLATFDIGIDDVEAVGKIAMSVGIFRQLDTMGLMDCSFVGLFDNVGQMICASHLF